MKKLICLLVAFLLLCGCGSEEAAATVDLMPNAQPDTSALTLYLYDGQTITRRHLFEDTIYRENVMKDFHEAKATAVAIDVSTLTPPFYGIEMGAGELGMVCGTGNTYTFDYDFDAFLQTHPWDEPDAFSNLAVMPCANFVAKTENGWNKAFLTEAEPLDPPEGVFVTEALTTDNEIIMEFTNQSGEEWGYGYDYGLRVLLDEAWYYVPAEREMAFIEILCMLPDGVSTSETYSLEPYGFLPAGEYRLVTQGLFADFTVQ